MRPLVKASGKIYGFAFLIFFICLFISIYPDIFFFNTSFVKRDIFRYYYPVWQFSIEHMRAGEFPLWNPYSSYGTPFFANIQSCVLYPLTALLYLPDYGWAFNFYILFHLALSGFFVSVWMASCGASRAAQLVSGLAYCLGGYVMSSANVAISLCTLCYFPIVLLCLKKAFRYPGPVWKIATALVLCVQYLAGDPAIFFASILIIVMTVVYETLRLWKLKKKWSLHYFKAAALAVILFLGLSAFHLFSFVEFLFHSNRSAVSPETASRWSLYYNDLVSIAIPHFSDISSFFMDYWTRQSWVENNYAGVTVLVLASWAVLAARKTPMILRHLFLALFGLLLALGPWGGVHGVLYQWFPFFKFIRYPARFMYIFSFAIACLAGFGVDRLLDKKDTLMGKGPLYAVLWMIGFILAFQFIPEKTMSKFYAYAKINLEAWTNLEWTPDTVKACLTPLLSNIFRSLLFGTWMLLIGWLAQTQKIRRYFLILFVVLIVFADLVEANVVEQRVEGSWLNPQTKTALLFKEEPGQWRYAASPHTMQLYRELPRYDSLQEALTALADGMAPNHHLGVRAAYVGGYDSIYPKEGVELSKVYRQANPGQSSGFINMINAKYLINSDSSFSNYYRKLDGTALGDLCVNDKVMPRAFLVEKAVFLEQDKTMEAIFKDAFDAGETVYIDEAMPLTESVASNQEFQAPGQVDITRYSLNEVDMEVVSPKAQWLFFSDSYYPGWTASVNGQKTKIVRANYAFRAIRIPEGVSKVAWKYEPFLFRIGIVVSLCSWAACMVLMFKKGQPKNGR